jgi:hypothetical protein
MPKEIPYIGSHENNRFYFAAHLDNKGRIEVYLEGERIADLSIAAAEDLQSNLAINCGTARAFAGEKSLVELRAQAKRVGISNYGSMSRDELKTAFSNALDA